MTLSMEYYTQHYTVFHALTHPEYYKEEISYEDVHMVINISCIQLLNRQEAVIVCTDSRKRPIYLKQYGNE